MSFRPAADGTLRQPVLCSPLSPPLPVQRMRLRSPFPLLAILVLALSFAVPLKAQAQAPSLDQARQQLERRR